MSGGARRLALRPFAGLMRRAVLMLRAWRAVLGAAVVLSLLAVPGGATPPDIIVEARYGAPTGRYDHGVLGDGLEWGTLVLRVDKCWQCDTTRQIETFTIRLPENRVFEDIAPRLISGPDGTPVVMVVESDLQLGARLAIYTETGLVTATPFIGRAYRWLAPVGAADMDGDGVLEVAYIDRPHLAMTLRVWRLTDDGLVEVAALPGLSNHQIGWDFIPGGIRDCGDGPEVIVASGDWQSVMAVRLVDGQLVARDIGEGASPQALDAALACSG